MYSLSLTAVKKSVSLLLCLTLFACSSTEQVSSNQLSNNGYAQSALGTNYSHSQFSPINKDSTKKSLNSDHHLMMSLLNRPMTTDQAMMQTFAHERESYTNTFASYANNGVAIKGDKKLENSSNRSKHIYAQLISQDINAVSISAPQ